MSSGVPLVVEVDVKWCDVTLVIFFCLERFVTRRWAAGKPNSQWLTRGASLNSYT